MADDESYYEVVEDEYVELGGDHHDYESIQETIESGTVASATSSQDFCDDDSSAPPPSCVSESAFFDDNLSADLNIPNDDDISPEQRRQQKNEHRIARRTAAVSEGARKAQQEALVRMRSIQRLAARNALQKKSLEQVASTHGPSILASPPTPWQKLCSEIRCVHTEWSKEHQSDKARFLGKPQVERRQRALAELRRQAAREELARSIHDLRAARASTCSGESTLRGSSAVASAGVRKEYEDWNSATTTANDDTCTSLLSSSTLQNLDPSSCVTDSKGRTPTHSAVSSKKRGGANTPEQSSPIPAVVWKEVRSGRSMSRKCKT